MVIARRNLSLFLVRDDGMQTTSPVSKSDTLYVHSSTPTCSSGFCMSLSKCEPEVSLFAGPQYVSCHKKNRLHKTDISSPYEVDMAKHKQAFLSKQ